jgi:methionine-S-sulfoxide reductase
MIKKIFFVLMAFLSLNFLKAEATTDYAYFAGGCFWCMEAEFESVKGVTSVVSGYTGGQSDNPTYKEISQGNTGHYEVIQVTFEVQQVSYEKLLEIYWKNVDPTDDTGQFCDKGAQYRSAIFARGAQQKLGAEKSKEEVIKKLKTKKVHTQIVEFKKFYEAEEFHQDYYKKNPLKYKTYKWNCGRDNTLKEVWAN